MNFEQRTFEFIRKNSLMPSRGLALVGVSGGPDSMALLSVLAALRHHLGIQLHATHFNHRLRPEAAKDERFVRAWCGKLNIPLTVGRRRGGAISRLSEEDARKMRFSFFLTAAKQLQAQCVALAHTRNDLAETVLMRLMRGSGLYGIRAILPRRTLEGVVFVRPLIDCDRADIEDYLKSRKIPFCTDKTNHRLIYERNKVRRGLLPLLAREYNPQIIKALSDLAVTSAEDYEFLSLQARRQFEKINTVSRGKVKIALQGFRRQHPAVSRLILRQMVETLTGDPAALDFEHIHALEKLAAQENPGRVDLPHRLKAVKTQKVLELSHE
jgi:tRNA(Ile)-lysidine synthase